MSLTNKELIEDIKIVLRNTTNKDSTSLALVFSEMEDDYFEIYDVKINDAGEIIIESD